jgi:hypothetical protein
MKLTHITQTLEEAIKFTRKEQALVEREANNIIIGIEYEYHVDDCDGDGDGDGDTTDEFDQAVYERAYDLIEEKVSEIESGFAEEYADNDMDEFKVEDTTRNLNSIKSNMNSNKFDVSLQNLRDNAEALQTIIEGFDDETGFADTDDVDQMQDIAMNLIRFKSTVWKLKNEADSIDDDSLERIQYYLPGDGSDINDNFESFKEALTFIDNIDEGYLNNARTNGSIVDWGNVVDVLGDGTELGEAFDKIDSMSDYIGSLRGTDGDWDQAIKEGFRDYAQDIWDSDKEQILGFDPADIHSNPPNGHQSFWEMAEEEIREDGDIQEYDIDCIESIKEILQTNGLMHNVEDVVLDSSVTEGVEVISKPLKLNDALDFMESMFEHISEVGNTSGDTGMHVNMSIRGVDFNKANFNPIKLLMLLDHRAVNDLFPVRTHTGGLIEELDIRMLFDMAKLPTQVLLDKFHEMVNISKRHQNINFNNIHATDIETRRIEFRYFGGENYEQRYETIKNEIYRVAYALMVTFDPEFNDNEYLKNIIRELDRSVKKYHTGIFKDFFKNNKIDSFISLSEFIKKYRLDEYSDFAEMARQH